MHNLEKIKYFESDFWFKISTFRNLSWLPKIILHCNFFLPQKCDIFCKLLCQKLRHLCRNFHKMWHLIPQKITVFVQFCTYCVHYYKMNTYVIIFLKKWHFCTFVPKLRHLRYKTEQKMWPFHIKLWKYICCKGK